MLKPTIRHTPTGPGEVLRMNVLTECQLTQDELAKALGVSRYTVNQIINDKRNITTDMALRLARVLGTTADFWPNLQRDVDLYRAWQKAGQKIEKLPVLLRVEHDFVTLEEAIQQDKEGAT